MHPSPSRFFRFLTSLALGLLLSAFCLTTRLQAATLTVTNTNDNGTGSLRDTIAAAAPGDTINFAVTGTISLTSGQITINKDLTIQGPGANLLTVQNTAAASPTSRVFLITTGVTVSISGLTISDGNVVTAGGGGIFLQGGTLTVMNSIISNNMAVAGGGISGTGTLNVINSTISGNKATGGNGGGFDNSGKVNVTNSTISDNTAAVSGGGIYNISTLSVTNSTISSNKALSVRGGGIRNQGPLTVTNSTITNNMAPTGGGIYNDGNLVTSSSTIIAGNTAPNGPDFSGPVTTSLGYNLVGNTTGSTGFTAPTDILNQNPLLGPLQNNGGPTFTHALLAGSPAIDKGISNGLTTDQRGFARTVNVPTIPNAADGTDIGAFEFGANPFLAVQVADPAVCLDPNSLVGITATVTNPNAVADPNASFTATLPTELTAIAGTCIADSLGPCTIAPNGGTVTWTGNLNPGQTVTIIYRARIAATVAQGTPLRIDNTATVNGNVAILPHTFTINCPAIVNTRVSDQKAGSVLVFPYYTSTIGGASDTRMTISNISSAASTLANLTYVHLFLIDGTTCQQADLFLCLTPNASFSFKASEYDPGNTGYVLAVAVNNQGVPIQNNVLIGNAFVNTPQFLDNYGAESFAANSFAVATVSEGTATLYFDQVGYDAVPKQFAVEIQSPLDALGQQVITAGMSGDLTNGQLTGAAQVGKGVVYNGNERPFGSFTRWLTGTCQANAPILTTSPRVPSGMAVIIPSGQAGTLKFSVGGAVGLLLTPRTAPWRGIRTLHKTQTTATTLTIPIFVPVC
jgi:hypothetical protein